MAFLWLYNVLHTFQTHGQLNANKYFLKTLFKGIFFEEGK